MPRSELRRDGRDLNVSNKKIIGSGNTLTGDNLDVVGHGNTIHGSNCTVTGDNCRLIGNNNKAYGNNNTLTGANCSSYGENNTISGPNASMNPARRPNPLGGAPPSAPAPAVHVNIFGPAMEARAHMVSSIFDALLLSSVLDRSRPVSSGMPSAAESKKVPDEWIDEPQCAEGESECKICYDRAIHTTCVPCGHQCMCVTCSRKIVDKLNCPVCNQALTQIVRTFGK